MMVTVGFMQFAPVRKHPGQNVEQIRVLLPQVEVDLLVLPELANSGYLYAEADELVPYAESVDNFGVFLTALQAFAATIDGVIVSGFAEWHDGKVYNSAVAMSAAGVEAVYRKVHLFADENDLFHRGEGGFEVFTFRGMRIGMMICFDWAFPEAARTLALKGAQVIAHPSNLVLPYCQRTMMARSIENCVYSVTANRYGHEAIPTSELTFTGQSQILDTNGDHLAQAPVAEDCVLLCEIDLAQADNKMLTARNHAFADRRLDQYQF